MLESYQGTASHTRFVDHMNEAIALAILVFCNTYGSRSEISTKITIFLNRDEFKNIFNEEDFDLLRSKSISDILSNGVGRSWPKIIFAQVIDICDTYIADLLSCLIYRNQNAFSKIIKFKKYKENPDIIKKLKDARNNKNFFDYMCFFSTRTTWEIINVMSSCLGFNLICAHNKSQFDMFKNHRNKIRHLWGLIDQQIQQYHSPEKAMTEIPLNYEYLLFDIIPQIKSIFMDIDSRAVEYIKSRNYNYDF